MRKTKAFGTLSLAGLVGVGLLSWPVASAASADDGKEGQKAYFKREDHVGTLALVDHDDDDDTNAGPGSQTRTRTRANTRTNTRGRDHSRGNKVRDVTRDGGRRHVDHSRHHTNDRSRHNTRG